MLNIKEETTGNSSLTSFLQFSKKIGCVTIQLVRTKESVKLQ